MYFGMTGSVLVLPPINLVESRSLDKLISSITTLFLILNNISVILVLTSILLLISTVDNRPISIFQFVALPCQSDRKSLKLVMA